MTTEEINREIAEFMGWGDKVHHTISPSAPTEWRNDYKRFDSPDGKISLSYYWDDFTTSLPYHTSWDWLFLVLDKIVSLNPAQGKQCFEYTISRCHCRIWSNDKVFDFKTNWKDTITATHMAVFQFVIWYKKTYHNSTTPL